MRYVSVCSGIEAATVAWHGLGWLPLAVSEIASFPCAVLAHHYPTVPNLGDMTRYETWPDLGTVDLLVGGTPCQSFSFAGLRAGLADPRGNLMLTFGAVAARLRARWLVWENVPGVLSSDAGWDFGAFLGMLAELGYGFAYRVLDAQYAGVPQRRRCVFVVGYLGDWRPPAAVLFEPQSLRGDSPPCRGAGQGVAGCIAPGTQPDGFNGRDAEAGNLIALRLSVDADREDQVAVVAFRQSASIADSNPVTVEHTPALRKSDMQGQSIMTTFATAPRLPARTRGGGGFGTDAECDGMVIPVRTGYQGDVLLQPDGIAVALPSQGGNNGGGGGGVLVQPCAFKPSHFTRGKDGAPADTVPPLSASNESGDQGCRVGTAAAVRRLTPRECERLQGFPDDYTLIPYRGRRPASDGPRYKALGNSMAVPVMRWLGKRIALVDALMTPPGQLDLAGGT